MALLRDLAIAVGFQIDPSGLEHADQMTDQFKANAVSAETNALQLGAAVSQVGAEATAGMGGASAATAGLGAQVGNTGGLFGRLREAGSKALDALKNKYEQHKEKLQEVGQTLKENRVAIGAAFALSAGIIATSVGVAANFEASMSRVGAISRASDEDMARLTATAQELGATTAFSASQAARGMEFLMMAGFDTNQTIATMPGLLDTAAAAGADLGVTADIVSNILTGFNLEAEQTGRLADVLTATFTSSNTTLGSLGESMKMVAPVAAALGVEVEDTAALVAALGDAGIQGTMAGTALRTIMTSLAAPTGAAANAISSLGIQTTDAAGNMLPITGILGQIAEKTADMGAAQRAATLEAIAGREGISALSALMSVGADNIDAYADSLRNSAGVAAEVASRQMDNLHGAITQFRSAIEGAQISLGSTFIPILRFGANALTAVVGVFNKLPQPLKTTIAVGLAFVAMLSGAALAASFIIPQIGTMIKGFALLKSGLAVVGAVGAKAGIALSTAWLPVTLAIGAVVAAGLILQDVWKALSGDGDTLTARIFNWGAGMLGLSVTWGDAVRRIKGFFGDLWQSFRENPIGFLIDWSPFALLRRGTEALLGWFTDWLAGFGIHLPEITIPTFPDLVAWAMTPINALLDWLSNIDIGAAIGDAIGGAWDVITSPIESFTGWIRGWFPQSPAKYGPLSDIDQVGPDMVDTIADSIDSANVDRLGDAMSGMTATMSPAEPDDEHFNPYSYPGPGGGGTDGGMTFQINVSVDARGSGAGDAERVGQTTAEKIRDVLDQWVAENYHSVALEGI